MKTFHGEIVARGDKEASIGIEATILAVLKIFAPVLNERTQLLFEMKVSGPTSASLARVTSLSNKE